MNVAALYCCRTTPYAALPYVEVWDKARDARTYGGSLPVVCHPPCARWGRYATVCGKRRGDDGGCFEAALGAVRRCGGVLEHPAHSAAWATYALARPGERDLWGGRTVEVLQAEWGHRAEKRTWLYLVGIDEVPRSPGMSGPRRSVESLGVAERERTPAALAAELVRLARRAAV